MIPLRSYDRPTARNIEARLRPTCGYLANHPMLEEELELEESMRRVGVQRFRERINEAVERGYAHTTPAGLSLLRQSFETHAKAIRKWIEDHTPTQRGRPHSCYRLLKDADVDTVAAITIRCILDSVRRNDPLASAGVAVGGRIEDDCRFAAFEAGTTDQGKLGKALSDAVHRSLNEEQVRSYSHRRRSLYTAAEKAGIHWTPWKEEQRLQVGVLCIELLRRSTGIIERTKLPNRRKGFTYGLTLSPETLEWIDEYHDRFELSRPSLLPMVVEPKDWHSPWGGGYVSTALAPVSLVKTRRQAYLEELRHEDLSSVYDAVNRLQRTRWRINQPLLEVVRWAWETNQNIAGLERKEDLELPAKPADIETNEESLKEWKRRAKAVYTQNYTSRSRRLQMMQTIQVAQDFAKYERIYYPYQLDFRGRIYPLPSLCPNPQGDDLSRSLIEFAEGKVIDSNEAVEWFLIHGANCAGIDKVSFADRMAWVEENHERIIAAAEDPYENLWWSDETELDSPWAFLAWCFEYAQWVREPDTFRSRIAVAMDGSCSGVQMFALMLRDVESAKAVNVYPSHQPEDMYQRVADAVHPKVEEALSSEDPDEASYAQRWLSIGWTRKTVKRACMTLAYGVTAYSVRTFVREWYDKAVRKGKIVDVFGPETQNIQRACNWFGELVWEAITEVNVAACRGMDWLQGVTKEVTSEDVPLVWRVPSGFAIQQAYPYCKTKQVDLRVEGERLELRLDIEDDKKLNPKRQVNGIAPNYVHSYDACLMTLTIESAGKQGITDFAMIHDSFGTHAADAPQLAATVRDQAAKIFAGDVLSEFRDEIVKISPPDVEIPAAPKQGSLDPSVVRDSLYFVA